MFAPLALLCFTVVFAPLGLALLCFIMASLTLEESIATVTPKSQAPTRSRTSVWSLFCGYGFLPVRVEPLH